MVATTDKIFAGSIPEIYERFLVPLIFEPYAFDLARRLAKTRPGSVLETAAGTGVLTRAIASALPTRVRMTVTDLNQPMLDHAKSRPAVFPQDPPRFLARTPHGYQDEKQIRQELKAAGFTDVSFDAVDARSKAPSPRNPAVAYCQGTPLRNEIEARGAPGLEEATKQAADAMARRFGSGAVDGRIRAFVVSAS